MVSIIVEYPDVRVSLDRIGSQPVWPPQIALWPPKIALWPPKVALWPPNLFLVIFIHFPDYSSVSPIIIYILL